MQIIPAKIRKKGMKAFKDLLKASERWNEGRP